MYDEFYKLTADPFRLSPDHRFSFGHRTYAEAKAYLEYALNRGEGFITITGEAGTGKTTLIAEILNGIDDFRLQVATLSSTQLEGRDLLHMVSAGFGLSIQDGSKVGLLLALEKFLAQQCQKGHHSVLIVDEAQGLSPQALEELRLLANLQLNDRLLLQIFLVGQELLRDVVRAPGMEHLSQRIIAAAHLEPLSLEETVSYIEHRLSRVRWLGDPGISGGALRLIHKYSGGVPRRINLICSRLFLYGAMEGKHELTGADAQAVIEGLQQETLLSCEASECAKDEDAEKLDADGELSLTLPRNPPAASQADETEQAGATGARVDDAPQRVSSTTERTEPARREPQRTNESGGGGAPESSWAHATEDYRAAPDVVPMASSKTKPDKRRNMIALLVVAVVVTLAFGLAKLNRGETPPKGAVMTGPIDRPVAQSDGSVESDVTAASGGLSAQPAINADEDGMPAQGDASAGSAEADLTAPEPNGQAAGTDSAESKSGVLPSLATGEGAENLQSSAAALTDAVKGTDLAAMPDAAESSLPAVLVSGGAAKDTAPPAAPTGAAQVKRPQAGIDPQTSQMSQLTQAARERFDKRLEQTTEGGSVSRSVDDAPPVPQAPVTTRTIAPLASQPKTSPVVTPVPRTPVAKQATAPLASQPKTSRVDTPVRPSVPKVALAQPTAPARPAAPSKAPVNSPDRIKAALLEGQWTSQGKPASLLPSDVTLCQEVQSMIACWSVPRNVNTKYGEALYKVEATLQNFSSAGSFRIAYRTLVKLLGSGDGDATATDSGDGSWQVAEYTMACRLTFPNRVSCRDEKGVVREYGR